MTSMRKKGLNQENLLYILKGDELHVNESHVANQETDLKCVQHM